MDLSHIDGFNRLMELGNFNCLGQMTGNRNHLFILAIY